MTPDRYSRPAHGSKGMLEALVKRGLRPDCLLVAAALILELDRWAWERGQA